MTSVRRWIAQGLRTPPTLRRHTWPFRTSVRTSTAFQPNGVALIVSPSNLETNADD